LIELAHDQRILPGLKPGNGDKGDGAPPYGLGTGGTEGMCPSMGGLS